MKRRLPIILMTAALIFSGQAFAGTPRFSPSELMSFRAD